jgi:hypothetical protein
MLQAGPSIDLIRHQGALLQNGLGGIRIIPEAFRSHLFLNDFLLLPQTVDVKDTP